VFGDTDLAIGTYRRAVSTVIPDMTRLAWKEKRDEILEATPDLAEGDIVYSMTRREYEQAYGLKYRKPGLFARFVVMVFKVIPKFGPFKPLAFEPLTSEAQALFDESFSAATARYRDSLRALRSRTLPLNDVDLDTGQPVRRGANPLADETYADLLKNLAATQFADVPPALRTDINEHFASRAVAQRSDRKSAKQEREAARRLAALNGAVVQSR